MLVAMVSIVDAAPGIAFAKAWSQIDGVEGAAEDGVAIEGKEATTGAAAAVPPQMLSVVVSPVQPTSTVGSQSCPSVPSPSSPKPRARRRRMATPEPRPFRNGPRPPVIFASIE